MKITVTDDFGMCLEQVFSGLTLRTEEGNEIAVCMRDDTFEINVMPKGSNETNWWRIDMTTGVIERFGETNTTTNKDEDQ